MTILRLAYLIDGLVTCLFATILAWNRIDLQNATSAENSRNLSLWKSIIFCLWIAMAVCLFTGVLYPIPMLPVLILQLIYKLLWIVTFAIPRWINGKSGEIPFGILRVFALYCVTFPWIIPWSRLMLIWNP